MPVSLQAPSLMIADTFMPLAYEIACIVLTALFFFAFSVAREPRGWRRLFQSMFATNANFSVNRNKVIDESLKRYGIVIAMAILVVDVGLFVWGVTDRSRKSIENMSAEDIMKLNEIQKIHGAGGSAGARKAVGE